MTATDELRRLLDERGVEYKYNEYTKVFEWHFDGTDGNGSAHATEVHGGINIMACSLTPKQAIDATLERGECHETKREGRGFYGTGYNSWVYELSCGHYFEWRYSSPPRFCPWCGRRIVEVGE